MIDLHGFVANLKDHVADHGFHVHGDRHFVETYSNRQTWEVELHPDHACGGPLDIVFCMDADARTIIEFEDDVNSRGDDESPDETITLPISLSFVLPPLHLGPDLLVLATDLAAVGGTDLPVQVSALDKVAAVTDAAERSISIECRLDLPLSRIFMGQDLDVLCNAFDRARSVCEFLLDRAPAWLGEG